MNRNLGWIALLPLCLLLNSGAAAYPHNDPRWVTYAGGEGPGKGKTIVLLSGDEEYRSEEGLPQLARILALHHGFECTVLFSQNEEGIIDPDNSSNIPGMHLIGGADLVIMLLRFRRLPDEDMAHLVKFVEAGKPLIGLRTATHAFRYEDDSSSPYAKWSWRNSEWQGGFGRQVLGETWVNHHGHHGKESTRGVIAAGMEKHAILRGVTDVWGPTDVYGIRDLPSDAMVLLEGSVRAGMNPEAPAVEGKKNNPRIPLLWTRERKLEGHTTQRIVCTTMGASMDLESAGLRRAIVNGSYWCLNMQAQISAKSSVEIVGNYKPTPFGFGKSTRGVRPQDHAWPKQATGTEASADKKN
jgi:hypothetical protein